MATSEDGGGFTGYFLELSMDCSTDRIQKVSFTKNGPLSRVIMRERLKWLGYVLWMKDDRLPKMVFLGHLFR